jgi:hypothetical protein
VETLKPVNAFADAGAADDIAPLENQHAPPGARQVAGVTSPLCSAPITMAS